MLIDFDLFIKTMFVLLLALISPGPDFVMVLRNSLSFGRKAGIVSALGVASGCLISFTIVMFGLKVLFTYHIIKGIMSLICGAYLVYIGFMSIRNRTTHNHVVAEKVNVSGLATYFRAGLMTNVFNPKLYTLVIAILTYTEQQHPSLATNFAIVIGQALMALVWFSFVAYILSYSKIQDAYLRKERMINIIIGFIFIIIGSRIMFG